MRDGGRGLGGGGDEVGDAGDQAQGSVRLHTLEALLENLEAGANDDLSTCHQRTIIAVRGIHVPLHVGVADQAVQLARHGDDGEENFTRVGRERE